jgi:hypothetical protein
MTQKEIFNSAMKTLKIGAGLSCHFAVDKLHSVLQPLSQVFPQNH